MALDTGSLTGLRLVDPLGYRVGPSPDDYPNIGEYLRALREHQNLSLAELAVSTRIRKSYLAALEEGNLSALPSRPFAIGYIRAYAAALGVDGEAAVARFKRELPYMAEPLRGPVGVQHEEVKSRRPLVFAAIAMVVTAVVLWNIAQRAMIAEDPKAPKLHARAQDFADPLPPPGPVKIGAPTPPPAEATTPTPYVTPGMIQAEPGAPAPPPPAPQLLGPIAPDSLATFTPQGEVYGVGAAQGPVALYAHRPTALVIRGADKTVYFARQLRAGDAYRAPMGKGLTADAADPSAIDVYVQGKLMGVLGQQLAPIDKLPLPPPPPVVQPAAAATSAAAAASAAPAPAPLPTPAPVTAQPPLTAKAPGTSSNAVAAH